MSLELPLHDVQQFKKIGIKCGKVEKEEQKSEEWFRVKGQCSSHGSNGHLTHGTDQQLEFKAAVMFPIMRQKHSTNNLNTIGP